MPPWIRTLIQVLGMVKCFDSFRYHLQSAHTAEKKYKCDKCGFSTKTSSALSSHIHRVHTKELSHMCSTCGKRFFAAVSLNKHIRSVHLKKEEDKTKTQCYFRSLNSKRMDLFHSESTFLTSKITH